MLLVCDSGSTKSEWIIVNDSCIVKHFFTGGLNPSVMGLEVFEQRIASELLPEISAVDITELEFYGAGCTDDLIPCVADIMKRHMPNASEMIVAGDLLGAAKAACGNDEGIAAILGTGSNSCLFDGKKIIRNTPALGFILGDEGSGAVLGRIFLNAVLKGLLPQSVTIDFEAEFSLSLADIICKVYREGSPNKFLASMSPFIHRHLNINAVRMLVVNNFRDFFTHNIAQYGRKDLPVNCVGSMAFHFESELREAAQLEGYTIGKVIKSPVDGFIL